MALLARQNSGGAALTFTEAFLPPMAGNGATTDPFLLLALVHSLSKVLSSAGDAAKEGGGALVKVARECLVVGREGELDGARRAREQAHCLLQERLNRWMGSPTKFGSVGAGGWDARMSGRMHEGGRGEERGEGGEGGKGEKAVGGQFEEERREFEERRRGERDEGERVADARIRREVLIASLTALEGYISRGGTTPEGCFELAMDAVGYGHGCVESWGVRLLGASREPGGRNAVLSSLGKAGERRRRRPSEEERGMCACLHMNRN